MLQRSNLALCAGRLLTAAGFAALVACSQQPPAATPAANPPAAPAASTAPAETGRMPGSSAPGKPHLPPPVLKPPDGKWLTDDQGRQYFLEEMPKVEGWYHWVDEKKTQVRLWYGMTYDVASEDDDSFQVKVYKVENQPAPPKQGPTAEEKEKVAASYRNTTGTVDRLTFEAFAQGLPARGQWRNGFKVADMNGDGHPDIVHGPARKTNGPPVIFLGDGKGGWRRWAEVRFPRLRYDYGDVAVADWNGDGRLDLALAIHLRGLIALVADGPQSFKEWSEGLDFEVPGREGSGGGFSSRTLEAADWNGDGRPDLVSVGEGPLMAAAPAAPGQERPRFAGSSAYGPVVYLNQGDGSWVRKDEWKAGARLFGEDLAVADFTNDGHLDMILATSVLGESDILRIGSAGAAGEAWTKASLPGLRPTAYVGAVDVADFDRDGRSDLVVGYLSRELGQWRTGIDVFLGRADGSWERRPVAMEETRDWLTALGSGDLDGDGIVDLAATTGDGEVWLFLGKGDGSFAREQSPEVPPSEGGCRGYDVQIVNLDADPVGELVAEFSGEPSALFAPDQCPSEGSLKAWKGRPRS